MDIYMRFDANLMVTTKKKNSKCTNNKEERINKYHNKNHQTIKKHIKKGEKQ
jgi:hypothetical protein